MNLRQIALIACFTVVMLVNAAGGKADISRYDFGDKSSVTLTTKAWDALKEKDYDAVFVYTKKCVSLYQAKARMQQNHLQKLPESQESLKYWALNDVATCYYLMGEAYFALGKYTKARRCYETVIEKLYYAQYYDPAGFMVKVKDCCEQKLVAVESITGRKEKASEQETGQKRLQRIDIKEKMREFEGQWEK